MTAETRVKKSSCKQVLISSGPGAFEAGGEGACRRRNSLGLIACGNLFIYEGQLTQNSDINTMFISEMSTAASELERVQVAPMSIEHLFYMLLELVILPRETLMQLRAKVDILAKKYFGRLQQKEMDVKTEKYFLLSFII